MTDTLTDHANIPAEPPSEPPLSDGRTGRVRASLDRVAPLALVVAPIVFNLWVLRDERLQVNNVSDVAGHLSMVRWAEQRIRAGHLPFDGWYPQLSAGLPQFHQYQSLAHSFAGLLALAFGALTTVQWINYLGLALWPLAVYWGARLFGIDRVAAGCAALLSPLIVSAPGYGYEHDSYTWSGLGVWSQLFGMWLLPIALPLAWRALRAGKGYAIAALVLALTFALHFLTGYLAILCVGVWVLVKPSQLPRRVARAFVVVAGAVLVAAWVVVPLVSDGKWEAQTIFEKHTFFDDSYGAKKVLSWLFRGELFDFGRWPVISLLLAVGVIVCLTRVRSDERSRALLGFTLLSLVLFFGRPALGPALRLLPGSGDLLLHRFIMGVHMGGIWIAGIGAAWLGRAVHVGIRRVRPTISMRVLAPTGVVLLGALLLPGWSQVEGFDAQSATWIHLQRGADATDGADVQRLIDDAQAIGPGRFYAGMTNNWGRSYTVYTVPVYEELLDRNVDAIGFTLRTNALTSDVEAYFNEADPAEYDLFNIPYVILPAGRRPPAGATLIAAAGRHRLYAMATTGYLEVVDTIGPAIIANRATMSEAPAQFLRSDLLQKHEFPTVAFDGAPAAAPSLPPGVTPADSPGSVGVQYSLPNDGAFGGQVTLNRTAVVLLKASYHPRWKVTVDGKPAKIEMIAPSFVGVTVPAGSHRVAFHYESYQYYWVLFLVGALTLVALVVIPRGLERRRASVDRLVAEFHG